jgi:hypothetical protein
MRASLSKDKEMQETAFIKFASRNMAIPPHDVKERLPCLIKPKH